MQISIDKRSLKYLRNYLSFQKDGSDHKGLKLNFQHHMHEANIEDLFGLQIADISQIIYANLKGKHVLDVFFNYISLFEKPWLRITLDDKLYLMGGPDCYIDALNDDECVAKGTYQTMLPSDFILELLSKKLPDLTRDVGPINLLDNRILLRQIELKTLNNYLFPTEIREQIIPLDKLPYLIEQAGEITQKEITEFNYKTTVVVKPYPFNPLFCNPRKPPIFE